MAEIVVDTNSGLRSLRATLVTPHLAVHRGLGDFTDQWAVTHVLSGAVLGHAESRKEAIAAVKQIAKVAGVDWHAPMLVLRRKRKLKACVESLLVIA